MTTKQLILIASLLVPVSCLAQSTIPWSVIDMGFGVSSSNATTVTSLVGQAFIGTISGSSSVIETGFLTDTLLRGSVVSVAEPQSVPIEFRLHQNYPNPFNPITTIRFEVPKTTMVTLKVYDLLGQEVLSLIDGEKSAGVHAVRFDASGLSSGMYICRIRAGDFVEAKRLLLLK
jgi:hypothetical protein